MRALPGVALLAGLMACGGRPAVRVPPADLPWRPFYWARVTTDSARFDRAAIFVEAPLRPGDTPSLLQLDLAASGGMPEGFPSGRDGRPATNLRRTGQLYGLLAGMDRVFMSRAGSRDSSAEDISTREIGTLGLANYEARTLLLDLARQRMAEVLSPADLGSLLGPRAVTVPIEYTGNRVLLVLETRTGRAYRALLDTGLSPFALWAGREMWEELTGLSASGPATRRYVLTRYHGKLVFVGAPARQALRLGSWSFRPGEVVFLAEGPPGAALEEWPEPVDAVVGPATLAPEGMLALDLSRRKLGVARERRE